MKIVRVYCDLCGELKGENVNNELDCLDLLFTPKASKVNVDLHVCKECLEMLNEKAERNRERVLLKSLGVNATVKEEDTIEEIKEQYPGKRKTLQALNVLAHNYSNNGVVCTSIDCKEDNCPFNDENGLCTLKVEDND